MNEEKKKQPKHKKLQQLLKYGRSSIATDPFCLNKSFYFDPICYVSATFVCQHQTIQRIVKGSECY